MKIKIGEREYTLNNNSDKLDRAKKDAGDRATPEQILAHYDKLAGLIKDENGVKVENGKFWEKERKEKFIEKAVTDVKEREKFHEDFLKYLKKERSNYAKLILQENLISYEIISLLFLIHSIINVDFIGKNNNFQKTKIFVKFTPKDLQAKTLGQLIQYLGIFLNDNQFIAKLNKLNVLRNKITHNIFYRYQRFTDVHRESARAVAQGEEILDEFKIIIEDIIKSSKNNMIKEIKGSDKISDSRLVINNNFKDLDKRLRKTEEKLKIKTKKSKSRN
ncbi:MAG: hypothetical protein AABX80_00910 [Nanoarchaeota archaeon]